MKKQAVALALFALAVVLFFAGLRASRDPPGAARTTARYEIPDLVLVNQEGVRVRLRDLLLSDRATAVNFVYATCTTLSPVLAASFASFQGTLVADTRSVQLVSVTIDPENDTPKVAKAFLESYRARPGWDFLTGTRADVEALMRALNAYMPDKESHFAVTFFRGPGQDSWVRLDGLIGRAQLLREWEQVAKR